MERNGKIVESHFNSINGIPSIMVKSSPDGFTEIWIPGCNEKIIVPVNTRVSIDIDVEETKIGGPVRIAAWREI